MTEIQKKIALVAGAVALLGGTFLAGRYTVPIKVVERIVEKQVIVEKVSETKLMELVEQNREFRNQLTEIKKSIHRETRTIKHPNGLVETTKVEDINVSKVVKEQEIKYVDRENKVVETKYVDRTVEVEKQVVKTVEAKRPDWRAGVLVGVNLTDMTKPVYGGMLERRIVGPLSVVGTGFSNGTATVGISLEF